MSLQMILSLKENSSTIDRPTSHKNGLFTCLFQFHFLWRISHANAHNAQNVAISEKTCRHSSFSFALYTSVRQPIVAWRPIIPFQIPCYAVNYSLSIQTISRILSIFFFLLFVLTWNMCSSLFICFRHFVRLWFICYASMLVQYTYLKYFIYNLAFSILLYLCIQSYMRYTCCTCTTLSG